MPNLSGHSAVLDAFAECVEETLEGANRMNRKLCADHPPGPRALKRNAR